MQSVRHLYEESVPKLHRLIWIPTKNEGNVGTKRGVTKYMRSLTKSGGGFFALCLTTIPSAYATTSSELIAKRTRHAMSSVGTSKQEGPKRISTFVAPTLHVNVLLSARRHVTITTAGICNALC